MIVLVHPVFACLEIGQRPAAGDAVPGSLGFPALGQKHEEQSRADPCSRKTDTTCPLSSHLASALADLLPQVPVAGIFHMPRRRIGLCWEATRAPSRPGDMGDVVGTPRRLPFIMFLVQSEKSQGAGDRVPSLSNVTVLSDRLRSSRMAVLRFAC